MRVFGCAWKMHFLEMLFSPNVFMVWIDFRFYFTFKYHFLENREREGVCEWDRAGAQRERERERPLPATHELRLRRRPRDFAPRTQIVVRLRHSTLTSNCTHWLRWWTQRPGSTFDFEFELHPLTSPANPEARIAVRPWVRIAPFDFAGEPRGQDHHSTSTSPAPIALSSRLRNSWVLMNLTGFDEFFLVGFWWI